MTFMIYLVCLLAGLLFTLLSAVLGHFFGGGHEGHMDGSHGHAEAGIDSSDMPGVSAFSPTIIAIFITAFGGIGIILCQFERLKHPFISSPLAALGALMVAGGVLSIMRKLFSKTQSSSESKVRTLVGVGAQIITPIPEGGVGEIAYEQMGSRYTGAARTADGTPIRQGTPVKIVRIVGSQFFVEPA